MVKIRDVVMRVVIGLIVAGAIGSQIPHVNSVAFAAGGCPSVFQDADNPAFGLSPQDLAYTPLGVDVAVGVGYALTAHHGAAANTASNKVSSPFAEKQVNVKPAIKPVIAATAR